MTPHEVASIISAQPAVLQCAVVSGSGRSGEPILVAHYVLRPGVRLSAAQLRAVLAASLPADSPPVVLRHHATFPPTRKATLDLDLAGPA